MIENNKKELDILIDNFAIILEDIEFDDEEIKENMEKIMETSKKSG